VAAADFSYISAANFKRNRYKMTFVPLFLKKYQTASQSIVGPISGLFQ
jgi:hypothetical protein